MPRPINYALDRSDSYQGVQAQLLDLIDAHLPDPKPAETVTDEFGFAVFDWTLATAPGKNTVTIEVVGSERPPLVLEAEGVHTPLRQRNPRREIFR